MLYVAVKTKLSEPGKNKSRLLPSAY